MKKRKEIKWTPYLATAYAEGFCEGEGATDWEQLQAWAYLIKSGMTSTLQGSFGRAAQELIKNGFITVAGELTDKGKAYNPNK